MKIKKSIVAGAALAISLAVSPLWAGCKDELKECRSELSACVWFSPECAQQLEELKIMWKECGGGGGGGGGSTCEEKLEKCRSKVDTCWVSPAEYCRMLLIKMMEKVEEQCATTFGSERR